MEEASRTLPATTVEPHIQSTDSTQRHPPRAVGVDGAATSTAAPEDAVKPPAQQGEKREAN